MIALDIVDPQCHRQSFQPYTQFLDQAGLNIVQYKVCGCTDPLYLCGSADWQSITDIQFNQFNKPLPSRCMHLACTYLCVPTKCGSALLVGKPSVILPLIQRQMCFSSSFIYVIIVSEGWAFQAQMVFDNPIIWECLQQFVDPPHTQTPWNLLLHFDIADGKHWLTYINLLCLVKARHWLLICWWAPTISKGFHVEPFDGWSSLWMLLSFTQERLTI